MSRLNLSLFQCEHTVFSKLALSYCEVGHGERAASAHANLSPYYRPLTNKSNNLMRGNFVCTVDHNAFEACFEGHKPKKHPWFIYYDA